MNPQEARPAFVLVGTQLAENLGAVCRTMQCFGFERLHLVRPQCDPLAPDCVALAAGAEALAASAMHHENLEEALVPFRVSVGLTRRSGRERPIDGTVAQVLEQLQRTKGLSMEHVAFVFGPEASGLSTDDTQRCELLATIPTTSAYGSLNLAHALTCVCYELSRQPQAQAPPESQDAESNTAFLASHQEQVHQALLDYLDGVDFYTAEPREVVSQRSMQMLRRSLLTSRDLHFLTKILRKLARRKSP